jgi:hypothetical protein
MSEFENDNEKCIELFCKTVAELNTISLKQMEGLLNIAITAAEASNSNVDAPGAAKFVDELKAAAGEISRSARNREEEIYKNIKSSLSAEPEHSFCAAVEQKLIIALENSLTNQQQLNVLGEEILTQAAARLLSPAAQN